MALGVIELLLLLCALAPCAAAVYFAVVLGSRR